MGFEEQFRSVALPLLRFGVFVSHAILFGLVPILLLVVRPAFAHLGPEWDDGRKRLARRFEGLIVAALVASVMASALILLLQSALVSELGTGEISGDSLMSVLETSFGRAVAWRFPLLVGLGVILVGRVRVWSLQSRAATPPSPIWWTVWGALSLALLATVTYSGHSTVASPRDLAIANDLVHQATSGIWFAGIVLLAVLLPDGWIGKGPVDRLELLSPTIARFSRVAFISIIVVGITGVLNSFLHVGELNDLWDTGYGRTIATKLILFGGILALGGLNHFQVRHRIEAARAAGKPSGARSLWRRAISAELAIAIAVMAATGLLVGLARTKPIEAPPRQEAPADAAGQSASRPE